MSLSTRIRAALESEANTLSEIAFQSKSYWPYSVEQLEAWRENLAITAEMIVQSLVYVAESEGKIAGFYVLEAASGNWTLDHLWLLPVYMGRGIGRALLEHAVGLAKEGGAHAITIDADPNAEDFYTTCGAQRVSTVAAPIDEMPDRVRPQMVLAVRSQ